MKVYSTGLIFNVRSRQFVIDFPVHFKVNVSWIYRCCMTALAMKSQFDRRQLPDRRQQPSSIWGTLRWEGRRRKGFRRAGEGVNTYVDRIAPRSMWLASVVLIASALDAWLTLEHLERGGGEANPVMAMVLAYGNTPFVAVKMAMTSIGAWFLAVHYRFPLARNGLHAMASVYLLLMGYHVFLRQL